VTVGPFTHEAASVRVVFGAGARHQLAAEVDRLGLRHVVLVAARSCRVAADALSGLLDHRLTWRVDGVGRHAVVERADEVAADAARVGADGVVALGGGSATGLAKAVALTGLALVAVPTTYAGWELTACWATTDLGGHRHAGHDVMAGAATVVYDPELTLGLPPEVTAASGINALAHCLEALWSPGASPLSAPLALEGARALAEALPAAVAAPSDLKARSRLLLGACQAGMALAGAGSGLHERICQVVAGRLDVPPALIHAAVLAHVVAFNEPVLGPLGARMAVAVGAGRASTGLHELGTRLGLPMSLAGLGLADSTIPEVADEVMQEVPANPRPVDVDAIRTIVRAAWDGDLRS